MELSTPGADHNTNSSKVIKVSHNLQHFNTQGDNFGSIFIFHLGECLISSCVHAAIRIYGYVQLRKTFINNRGTLFLGSAVNQIPDRVFFSTLHVQKNPVNPILT